MGSSEKDHIQCCFVEAKATPEDITCVHAALASIDPEALLCVLMDTRLGWTVDPLRLQGAAKRHLIGKTAAMLGLMHDMEPAPMASSDQIIVPIQSFGYPGRGCCIERTISAAILDLSSVQEEGATHLDYAASTSACLSGSSAAVGDGKRDIAHGLLSSADAFIGTPWADVLGYAIWLPYALTDYERISVLAHLFWVMSFSGFAESLFEMRTVSLRQHGRGGTPSAHAVRCYEEHHQKMERVACLLSHNGMVDACNMAHCLKRTMAA